MCGTGSGFLEFDSIADEIAEGLNQRGLMSKHPQTRRNSDLSDLLALGHLRDCAAWRRFNAGGLEFELMRLRQPRFKRSYSSPAR